MKSVICTTVVFLIASALPSAASHDKPQKNQSNNGLSAQTDFKAMSPEEALAILRKAQEIKVDLSAQTVADLKMQKSFLNICNGKKYNGGHHRAEIICTVVADAYPPSLLPAMEALFRGCGIYALDSDESYGDSHSGSTCGRLGSLFVAVGNITTAKAIWEQAPGCHSHDAAGNPREGCASSIIEHQQLYSSEPAKLRGLLHDACDRAHDPNACAFMASHGSQIDLTAVEAENDAKDQEARDAVRERARERAEHTRESNARFNAAMDTLRSMPGGSDPNAIVNAANQQGAQMIAIGAANDALRQQASAERQAPPLTQAHTAQSQVDSPQASIASPAQPPSLPIADSSSENPPISTAHYAAPLPSNCIGQFWDPKYYNWLSFQNNCGQAVYVSWIAANSSDKFGFSSATLAPGGSSNSGWSQDEVQNKGGFLFEVCPAGYLPVDAVTDQPVYRATQEFRCKQH